MVKLIGTKTTSKHQVVSIVSPLVTLTDPSVEAYPLLSNLNAILEQAKEEVVVFHKNNHVVNSQQAELF